jgi:hypothetical protein
LARPTASGPTSRWKWRHGPTSGTHTGSGYFSVILGAAPASSITILPNTTNAYTSAFAVKYRATMPYTINVVRARLSDAPDNAGNVV